MNQLKQQAIKKGEAAEVVFIEQFGGKRLTNLQEQYADKDVIFPKSGRTYSIKDQIYSSGKYGGITVEMKLEDPTTGETQDGNLIYCEADTYGWAITWNDKPCWLLMHCKMLKKYVEENAKRFPLKSTMTNTTAQNAAQGRKFTKAWIHAIPLKNLLGELTEGKDYKLVEITRK